MHFITLPARTTSFRLPVELKATTTGAPVTGTLAAAVTAYYAVPGSAAVQITPLSDAAATDAYGSGKWAPRASALYELHLPDAALSSLTAPYVTVRITVSGCQDFLAYIALEAPEEIARFTAPSGATVGTVVLPSGASATDDFYPPGTLIKVVPANLATSSIREDVSTFYDGANRRFTTLNPGFLQPISGDTVILYPGPSPVSATATVDVSATSITAIATKVWTIDFTSIATAIDAVRRSPGQALRKLMNKLGISGTTLTVYKEDDSNPAYTETITATPGASPITGSDPN